MKNRNPFSRISLCICRRYMGTKAERRHCMKVREQLCSLSPMERAESLLEKYYRERVELILLILLAGIMGSVLLFIFSGTEQEESFVTSISRNTYGKGTKEEALQVTIGGEQKEEPLKISVQEQDYTKEEITALLINAAEKLDMQILGENPSLDNVTSDLCLITSAEGDLITISWEMNPSEVVNMDGTLNTEMLTEEGVLVELQARLTACDQEYIQLLHAKVRKPAATAEEKQLEELKKKIMIAEEEGRTEETLNLPEEINGVPIKYERETKKAQAWMAVPLLGVCALVFALREKNDRLKKAVRKRDRQLQLDYPEIINKLTLLFSAGLTIRSAWGRIVTEYVRQKEKGSPFRFAYEEMLLTYREIQGGMPESEAYDRFGRRCRLAGYVKLSMLLKQNLKKGSRGLNQLLVYEGIQAMEERKSLAKRMGEEAATKLLIPMFLMLAVVIAILIVPAFLSIQI